MNENVTRGLLLLAGVLGLLGLFLLVLSLADPEYVSNLGLGTTTLLEDLELSTAALTTKYHIKPILDLGLFIGAYILVCLISWSQERLRIYWTNRHHFR